MRERNFNKELYYFLDKIKNNINFSLSRWGDGELSILENKHIDLRFIKNGEFRYDPNIKEYELVRNILIESYKYQDDEYYIGIACKCCVGDDKYQYMKKLSEQKEENLTWANIFVNSNYNNFIDEYIPVFKEKEIIMVVNSRANVDMLSFKVKRVYKVGVDAWYNDYYIVNDLKKYIENNDITNHVFLFAAGPLANILTYELWKFNKNNTYIDIGSTLDVQMGLPATRGYLKGADTLKKVCIW